MTLAELFDRYCIEAELTWESEEKYRNVLRKFSEFLNYPCKIFDLTAENMERAMLFWQRKGNSARVVNDFALRLASLWRYAVKLRIVRHDPPSPQMRVRDNAPGVVFKPIHQQRRVQPKGQRLLPAGTLWHYFENEFKPKRLRMAAHSTVYQYELNLQRFDQYLGRVAKLADLTDDNVAGCIAWLINDQKLSVASATKLRDGLCCLWRFLNRKRFIDTEPDVPEPIEPKRIPIAWTEGQQHLLWEHMSRLPGDVCGIPANFWWCTLQAVLWDTGARISEVMSLEWPRVDLAGGWVVMIAETRKGRTADKLSRLHPETVAFLSRIRMPERDRVFPWHRNVFYLYRKYGDILKACGLPNDRYHKFHCGRKSVASHVKLRAGLAAASEAMGHADMRMTRDVYIDPRIAPDQQPADVLFRPYQKALAQRMLNGS